MVQIEDEYQILPLSKCEPHPMTVFRFNYDGPETAALADSIQKQGQLEPGYAVFDQKSGNYLVYIGQRRLAAAKIAQKNGAKLKGYKAYVTKNISDADIFERAIAENTERSNLDVTEWIKLAHTVISQIADKDRRKELLETAGRNVSKIEVAAKLFDRYTEDVLKSIYEIEQKTGTKLTLKHLEKIVEAKTPQNIIALTEHVCTRGLPASMVESLVKGDTFLTFTTMFDNEPSSSQDSGIATRAEAELDNPQPKADNPRMHGDFLTPEGLMYECPNGHVNFLEAKFNFLMKFKDPLDDPKDSVFAALDVTPNFVLEATKNCWKCQTPVVVKIASVDGHGVTMATAKTTSIKPFSAAPDKVAVYCNFDKKKYMVTVTGADATRAYVLDKSGSLKAVGR
jgi:hypothetical protein